MKVWLVERCSGGWNPVGLYATETEAEAEREAREDLGKIGKPWNEHVKLRVSHADGRGWKDGDNG